MTGPYIAIVALGLALLLATGYIIVLVIRFAKLSDILRSYLERDNEKMRTQIDDTITEAKQETREANSRINEWDD